MWLLTTLNVGGDHYRIILSMSYYNNKYIPTNLIKEVTPPSLIGRKTVEKFVKGPVPIWWLQKAWKECRPASLVFGLLLFHRRGMSVGARPITKAEMELFGITRWCKRDALEDLERAGLVKIERIGRRMVPILVLDRSEQKQDEAGNNI